MTYYGNYGSQMSNQQFANSFIGRPGAGIQPPQYRTGGHNPYYMPPQGAPSYVPYNSVNSHQAGRGSNLYNQEDRYIQQHSYHKQPNQQHYGESYTPQEMWQRMGPPPRDSAYARKVRAEEDAYIRRMAGY
jgi:hypothetical protein